MADQHRDIKMEDLLLGGGALMEHFFWRKSIIKALGSLLKRMFVFVILLICVKFANNLKKTLLMSYHQWSKWLGPLSQMGNQQWTIFLKPKKDETSLSYYEYFGAY